MKKRMDTKLIAGVVVLLLIVVALEGDSITGLIISENTALTLDDHATKFFEVKNIVFPYGDCMQSIQDIYGDVAYVPIDASTGYLSQGYDRFGTLSFVVERHELYGTMDFIKSPKFLAEKGADSQISVSSEAIVRVPKAIKRTYFVMDLLGVTQNEILHITKGRLSTPTADCIFWAQNGEASCQCNTHTIMGIAVGGVTAAPRVEERMSELFKGIGYDDDEYDDWSY